jgi:hypothetical protein
MRANRTAAFWACSAFALCGPARAYETTIGNTQISLDTTLSSGLDLRASDIDERFVGAVNGGLSLLPNADNGTLNFRAGAPVAATQRITTEIDIKHDDDGAFLRATGFYDPVIDSERTDFQPLSRAAVRDIGADLRLLDAYVFASPSIAGHPFDLRIGAQPINWGESSFIQFGINSTAPLDLTALRAPGDELREGILPIPAADVKTELGGGVSMEAFWQFVWTRDRLEPDGSFFGTNDTLFDGGRYAVLYPGYADSPRAVDALNFADGNALGAALPRRNDRQATSLDEFGIAFRRHVDILGGAEFAVYAENYGSRTPFGSYETGVKSAVLPSVLASLNPNSRGRSYTSTAGYFADYPRDIHLLGLSWSLAGPAGIAIQGEYSARLNQPIQLNTTDEGLAVNAPAACYLAGLFGPVLGASAVAACNAARADRTIGVLGGAAGFGAIIDGWKRYPVSQIQTTATKLLHGYPSLGIGTIALVGEIGFDYVHGFPADSAVFDAPYRSNAGFAFLRKPGTVALPPGRNGLATALSGAYTGAVIFDMPEVLPYGIGMRPSLTVQHDFLGTSPEGVNVFARNTAAASAGVTFTYLQSLSLTLQYTTHFAVFDGGKAYGVIDRDFVSAVLSYEL